MVHVISGANNDSVQAPFFGRDKNRQMLVVLDAIDFTSG
jgi:hypothetical protein